MNPDLDLFLVSTSPTDRLPDNVKQVRLSLSDIETRLREHIDPNLHLSHAYKLCDLKPFYALLFPEIISGYDYWGYCDIDLVFGDLSCILSAERLGACDVFFADAKMVMGHLALYRNDPIVNNLAFKIPSIFSRLSEVKYMSSDEDGMSEVMLSNPEIRWSMARELRESQLSIGPDGRMIGRTSGVQGMQHKMYWRDGRTFIESQEYGPQEVLYLHFMGLKRDYHWVAYKQDRTYNEFSFSAAGFVPWVTPPDVWSAWSTGARGGTARTLSIARGMVAQSIPSEWRFRAKEFLRRRAIDKQSRSNQR